MKRFPEHMKFRYPWRNYQLKVLESIEEFMEDNKLHIVAPPGSGKTVLGLKVAQFLNQPTLILCPSIAIQNQWRDRLVQDFLHNKTPDWISLDLHDPKFVTITTYQALHVAFKQKPEFIDLLKAIGIKTIIVDECHHLQKEWWKSLIQTVDQCKAQVLAITATPPYDVNGKEWARYHQLCGEIDIEINLAELVKEKNICPHQDYVFFSLPKESETAQIYEFYGRVKDLIEHLQSNDVFLEFLKSHPYLNNPENHFDEIYQTPSYFSSLLITLNGLGKVIPLSAIGIIGHDEGSIPSLNFEWLEIFIQGVLYFDPYFKSLAHEDAVKKVTQEVRKMGVIEKGKVRFQNPVKIDKLLRSSESKFDSIEKIVNIEYEQLTDNLRLVILTDYIRKEALTKNQFDISDINFMGVVPIFEHLRKRFPVKIELGILTGSLIIIPSISKSVFQQIISEKNIPITDFSFRSLPHDSGYLEINATGKSNSELVAIITALFSRGAITVLVGTKALLGEGWDAPAINTLILATHVGSYVSSNQIRGRAIRIHKKTENKSANIWHLVCLAPNINNGGNDFQILQRRFSSFYGPGFDKNHTIENGIDRLHLPPAKELVKDYNLVNQEMINRAQSRTTLKTNWLHAINKGHRIINQINIPTKYSPNHQRKTKLLFEKTKELIPIGFNRFLSLTGFYLVLSLSLIYFLVTTFISSIPSIALYSLIAFVISLISFSPLILKRFKILRQLQKQFKWLSKNWLSLTLLILAISISGFGLFFFLDKFTTITFLSVLGLLSISSFLFPNRIFKNWTEYKTLENIHDHLFKVALTVLITLKQLHLIDKNIPNSSLQIEQNDDNHKFYLSNVNIIDQDVFIKSLREAIEPIDNPRYLISKEIKYDKDLSLDLYYAVPKLIGKKKEYAELFFENWKKYVGNANLIFTRKPENREDLLKAKAQSLILGESIKANKSWR